MKTHITIILDKSGSMGSLVNDTIGGFNQFLKTQREVEGEATLTLVQFNGNYDLISDMVPLTTASELNKQNYSPNGGTALLDAIGRTINNVESLLDEKSEDEKPEKVIFVIITDGQENESREFTRDQVMTMINNHRDEKGWEFVFIGANQDAIQGGNSIGVRAGNSLNYSASAIGTQAMYSSLTRSMTSYRSKSSLDAASTAFFADDTPDEKEVKKAFEQNPKGIVQNLNVNTSYDKDK